MQSGFPNNIKLDYDNMTLDGQPITECDLLLLLEQYRRAHPNDKHIKNVVAFWAYGRDEKNPSRSDKDSMKKM